MTAETIIFSLSELSYHYEGTVGRRWHSGRVTSRLVYTKKLLCKVSLKARYWGPRDGAYFIKMIRGLHLRRVSKELPTNMYRIYLFT